jgi:tetratricopeptide (TPR) repeat protein
MSSHGRHPWKRETIRTCLDPDGVGQTPDYQPGYFLATYDYSFDTLPGRYYCVPHWVSSTSAPSDFIRLRPYGFRFIPHTGGVFMQIRILQLLGDALRFRDQDFRELGSRRLDAAELKELVEKTETAYRVVTSDPLGDYRRGLVDHGKRLFNWLDGPEQWLSGSNFAAGMALHIDVASNLRHLPWELLFNSGFLCQQSSCLFTPVYRVGLEERSRLREPPAPSKPERQNRPLRVLFMASSPENVEPVLDFENEEAIILENTRKQRIELVVEESGCLEQLSQRIADDPAGVFDVVHITGHAHQTPEGPRFILEDEKGFRHDADAREIADAFRGRYPRLLFLSGCETAKAGALPSLAEELVRAGCPAVLGWALPVGDVHASVTGAVLYESLAIGDPLDRAVAAARQKLLEVGSPYWHLLRLFSNDTILEPLVTPKNASGRKPLRVRAARGEFLDAGQTMEVCEPEKFVGRRRLIQQGLRVLGAMEEDDDYAEGLLLTGMGGLGKSSLAARFAERLPDFRRVVIVGAMDEVAFKAVVRRRIPDKSAREALESDSKLEYWLRDILVALEKPVLFIFDDFEKNGDLDLSGNFRPNPAAAHTLEVLARTIRETPSECRIIVTCRYRFGLSSPNRLAEIPLLSMRDTELLKKLSLIRSEYRPRRPELEERAVTVAAGNPRLLDRLYKLLASDGDSLETILAQMKKVEAEFREDVLLKQLIDGQTGVARRMLAVFLLVGIPLDPEELREIFPEAGPQDLNRTTAVGLLEQFNHAGEINWYYASPLLAPYLAGALDDEAEKSVSGLAARVLYRTRWEGNAFFNDDIGLAIHRLALAGSENGLAIEMACGISNRWLSVSAYRNVLALCEWTLEHVDDYRILHRLARAEQVLGETEEAAAHYCNALDLIPPVNHNSPEGELREHAALLNNMAGLFLTLGDPSRAMELMKQVLDVLERIEDESGRAMTLHNMAGLMVKQGKIDRGTELWEQSLDIFERIEDERGKAMTLHSMAGLMAKQGKIDGAMERWKQSLNINDQIRNDHGRAATLSEMALVQADQGNIDEAMKLWEQSLDIKEQIGDMKGKAVTLNNMAHLIAGQGNIGQAVDLWNQSLDIKEHTKDVEGRAATLNNLAWAAWKQGDTDKQRRLLLQAAETFVRIHAWPNLAQVLSNMGGVYALQGLWLGLLIPIPPDLLLALGEQVFEEWTPEYDDTPLLATGLNFLVHTRYKGHPQLKEFERMTFSLLTVCAMARGVAPEALDAWLEREKLNDPDYVIPALYNALLERIPPDSWLFDPRAVLETVGE